MRFLFSSSGEGKPESLTSSSSGTAFDGGWRRWWQIEAAANGFDWPGLFALHCSVVDRLRSVSPPWCSS